jgi:hypothetical protein
VYHYQPFLLTPKSKKYYFDALSTQLWLVWGRGRGRAYIIFGIYISMNIACKVTEMPTIIATAQPINNKSL